MAPFRPSRDLSSLRFRLPLFLMLYCSAVALVLYIVADRVQEARFERAFERDELVRATEIQSRTERAAERNELETGQREFGELAVFEELRAAVFVSPENQVVLSSRRDWSVVRSIWLRSAWRRTSRRVSRRRWSGRAGRTCRLAVLGRSERADNHHARGGAARSGRTPPAIAGR